MKRKKKQQKIEENEVMNGKKYRKLQWKMVGMLFSCWFAPMILLIIIMSSMVSNKINKQLEHTITTSAIKAIEISDMRIRDAITSSRFASYLPTIRESYEQYLENENAAQLSNNINTFLGQQYKYHTSFKAAMLHFTEDTDKLYYTINNATNGTFKNVKDYEMYAKNEVLELSKEIDTRVMLATYHNRLYLIRNLMDNKFKPYAVLILELNEEEVFGSLESILGYMDYSIYLEDQVLVKSKNFDKGYRAEFDNIKSDILLEKSKDEKVFIKKCDQFDLMKINFVIAVDYNMIVSENDTIQYVFYILLLFMIPLLGIVLYFFHKRVTKPIKEMIDFTDFIKDEQYGTTLENNTTDLEFYYLNEALNSMSLKLQYQFEKIYLEELALKDANIMALQSQINPHFLNNTLEIINWEARMMKNYKVSGMIESLSTMLEATMNRSGKQLISLAEEMSYVDAYLFIISQRFGEKFEVEKNIEDDLTTCEVPRLIIQPIIENAVEHGMDITTKGKVVISIFRKDDYLAIEIMDNGHMTDEEIERVEYLLSDQYEEEKTGTTRLGIRNVNERLKIMYGEKSGLTIKSNKEGFTVSTILVKCNK